jgi:hypothetical protein
MLCGGCGGSSCQHIIGRRQTAALMHIATEGKWRTVFEREADGVKHCYLRSIASAYFAATTAISTGKVDEAKAA